MFQNIAAGLVTSGPRPSRPRRSPLWRYRRPLFALAVLMLVGVSLAVERVDPIPTPAEAGELGATTFICANDVEAGCDHRRAINELSPDGATRVYVPLDELPDHLVDAVIATEDQRFYDHNGADPMAMARAVTQQTKAALPGFSGSSQGASTITQQYVKLVSGDDENRIGRKLREIVRAVKLEYRLIDEASTTHRFPKLQAKEQLLEDYLNRVWFGRRSYGVQAAALNYFDKRVQDLTIAESAYLAGLIRNPSTADYAIDPDEAIRRRETTISLMFQAGRLTEQERREALDDRWTSFLPEGRAVGLGSVVASAVGTDYFVAAVHRQLEEIFPDDTHRRDGVRVYTTLDRQLQQQAVLAAFGDGEASEAGRRAAIVALDDEGRVLALVGGRDWRQSQVNLALGPGEGGAGHRAGALLMPVVLAGYLEQGHSEARRFDSPRQLELVRDGVRLDVFGGGTDGAVDRTANEAVVRSSNTAMAQVLDVAGPAVVVDLARELGVRSTLTPAPSLALGLDRVSVLEMASVYATIDRGGLALEPVLIERIESSDGRTLCWHPSKPGDCDEPISSDRPSRLGTEAVVGADVTDRVNAALADVVAVGTGRSARLLDERGRPVPVTGKTAVNAGFVDAWFVGSACELTAAVWVEPDRATADPAAGSRPVVDEAITVWRATMADAITRTERPCRPR